MSLFQPDATDSTSSSNVPLEWTRLRTSSSSATGSFVCCKDPLTCQRPQLHHSTTTGSTSLRLPLDRMATMIQGYAVFCLQEPNPSWFQGYFIPQNSIRPWGLLAVQEEVDDCLGCADGGFRRVTVNIYPPPELPRKKEKSSRLQQQQQEPQLQLETVDWTGGDMIQLRHEQLIMNADRLWTGVATLPHLERYFSGLIAKLRLQLEANESAPILEFLPDVAVIVGKMSLVYPNIDGLDSDNDFLDSE